MAGAVNLLLAVVVGSTLPAWPAVAQAMTLGFFAYGISLTLFVVSLRHLGTARTGAYFSVAAFFGALLAVVWLGERVDPTLLVLPVLYRWMYRREEADSAAVQDSAAAISGALPDAPSTV